MTKDKKDIGHGEAWTVNAKAMFDFVLQDWQARTVADRELRSKLDDLYLGREQELSVIKLQATQTGQVTNAVIQSALVEGIMGRAIAEQTIEGKLAAQFPASVIEIATLMTDKLMNMVGVDALLAIVKAVAEGEADEK